MFILCLIYRNRVQTFCLEDDAPRQRLAALLPDNGTLTVGDGMIVPRGLSAVGMDGSAMADPLKTTCDFTCVLLGSREKALLIMRVIEVGDLSPVRYALPAAASIGRDKANTIVYQERFLSSCHGRFFLNASAELCYQDESKNGTAYNGVIVHNACLKLKNGDQITIPPMLHILVSGDELLINRPRGLLSCSLEPLSDPPDDGRIHVLVLLSSAGIPVRADLPEETAGLDDLRSCVGEKCPASLLPLLAAENVLLEGHTRRPLLTDGSLADSLRSGNRIFIIP